jgi:hypothetical protein
MQELPKMLNLDGVEKTEQLHETLHPEHPEQLKQEEVLTIDLVGKRFKEWRSKKAKKDSIPKELWKQAVNLTSHHSISKVCKNLGLSFSDLKKHVFAEADISKGLVSDCPYTYNGKETGGNFLEVKLDGGNSTAAFCLPQNLSQFGSMNAKEKSSCLIELSKSDGSTLKVYSNIGIVEQMESIDINRICEAFLKF